LQAVFDSFDIGFFIEAVLWWNYDLTTATREFCYSYGYASDQIDF